MRFFGWQKLYKKFMELVHEEVGGIERFYCQWKFGFLEENLES